VSENCLVMTSLKQLALNICLQDEINFENFYFDNNQEIVGILQAISLNKKNNFIYIWGAAGSGKSHLIIATSNYLNKANKQIAYLPLFDQASLKPAILENLENVTLLCIDDIDLIVGKRDWEEALLYCIKNLLDNGGNLLIAGNAPPATFTAMLPDLKSRLTSSLVLQVHTLTDMQKIRVLQYRAQLRGLTLPDNVAQYVLTHFNRNSTALFAVLDVLDKMALEKQRKLTIPFVKSVLELKSVIK
jgi:DnaA-homolog protein